LTEYIYRDIDIYTILCIIYILPVITYSCESLVTAQPNTLKVLEHAKNQALRLIIGAVKTTPIDAMTFITGIKPIQELIKEKAVLLHEKLLRIPGDQYWKTYENKPRNLKTQNGFTQKVTEVKTKFKIKSKPQPLYQLRNPSDDEQVQCYLHLHLHQSIIKGEIGTETLRHLALETMNTRYPQGKWLHIFTDGSQIDGYLNAGAGIHRELFSCYMPLGQHSTAFYGEIEAIRTELRLLNLHQNKFERAVIFSDSKAAILSAGSTETVIPTEAKDCQVLKRQLKAKHKQTHCSGYQDTVESQGMNMLMHWPKRVPKLHKHISENTSYHSIKLHSKQVFQSVYRHELETKLFQKPWKQETAKIPDWPRRKAVAEFRLCVGHDCLGTHL
jgi:hypothetical protein